VESESNVGVRVTIAKGGVSVCASMMFNSAVPGAWEMSSALADHKIPNNIAKMHTAKKIAPRMTLISIYFL
jgi:hypothetical protein